MKWDSLYGSAHTPMYNPNILPLNNKTKTERAKASDFKQLQISYG